MWKWAQGAIASVAGTAEPIYGPEAFESVIARTKDKNPVSDLTPEDYEWTLPEQSHVETSTFYITADSGHAVMCQIIHSKVKYAASFGNKRLTMSAFNVFAQFTCRVWHPTETEHRAWSSTNLEGFEVDEKTKKNFTSDKVSLSLSEDLSTYTFTVSVNPKTVLDVQFKRVGPGLKIGDSYSNYGEDLTKPWGYMRHVFWPRSHVTGTVTTNGHVVDVKGLGMYVHVVQGMKPHHAACKWNFGNFQGKKLSAVMMEFTTPPSYGSQVVNIGGIVNEDGTLVAAMTENAAIHKTTQRDEETGWDAPTSLELSWMGKTKDGVEVTALTDSDLKTLVERVDVLAEIPAVIKAFIAGIAGTKPFIYQHCDPVTLRYMIGDDVGEDEGILYSEATFIS